LLYQLRAELRQPPETVPECKLNGSDNSGVVGPIPFYFADGLRGSGFIFASYRQPNVFVRFKTSRALSMKAHDQSG
jgi:hypothetical protein